MSKGVHMQCVGVQTHCTTFSDYTLNILLSCLIEGRDPISWN